MSTADRDDNSIDVEVVPSVEEIENELNEAVEVSFDTTQRKYLLFVAALEGGMIVDPTSIGEVLDIKEAIITANPELHDFAMSLDSLPDDEGDDVTVSFTVTKYGFISLLAAVERGAMFNPMKADTVFGIVEAIEDAHPEAVEATHRLHDTLARNYSPDEIELELAVVPN